MSDKLPSSPTATLRRLNPHLWPAQSNDHPSPPQIPDAKPAQQARALEQDREGKAQSPGRPLVRFVLRRVRLLDTDAKWGSVKDLLDGVATAGLICGDREDQIYLEVTQEKVATFKEEETLIAITDPDGPATEPPTAPPGAPAPRRGKRSQNKLKLL